MLCGSSTLTKNYYDTYRTKLTTLQWQKKFKRFGSKNDISQRWTFSHLSGYIYSNLVIEKYTYDYRETNSNPGSDSIVWIL